MGSRDAQWPQVPPFTAIFTQTVPNADGGGHGLSCNELNEGQHRYRVTAVVARPSALGTRHQSGSVGD